MAAIEFLRGNTMLKRILMAVGLALSLPAHAAAFFFDPPIALQGAGNAYAVEVADVNGDGRDDLAALVGGDLLVFLQDGNGALATPVRLEIPGNTFFVVKAADIGGDGTNQLLVGHDGGLAVYSWNGAGGFSLENHPALSPCEHLATADLDFDGAMDVACHGHLGDATLYYSDHSESLGLPVYMATPVSFLLSTLQLQLADVTADGKPDLLLASGAAGSFFVFAHDSGRAFLPAVAYPYPEVDDAWSYAILAMDMDGDGANEVIVAKPCNSPCSSLLVYKRGNGGYLTLSRRIPTLDIPVALMAFDVDRDGHEDLLVGHSGWNRLGRYKGQARQLSETEVFSTVSAMGGSEHYAFGDLDHDGFTDAAVATLAGVNVLYGRRLSPNDFDGDGISDVLWRYSTGKNVIWRSADARQSTPIETVDPTWSAEATGDFDGNGSSEVFWRNRSTGANNIRYSTYTNPITAVTSQDWQVAGAGDFDGDGNADLLWRNARNGANAIWKSGNSAATQATTTLTDLRWKIVGVGDFDGDGQSDILWRHSTSGANSIWRGGQWSNPQAMAAVTNPDWRVAGVGDFNGDGRDDVLWHNARNGTGAIWLSADATTPQPMVQVTNLAWAVVAIGDYNGDGRSDVLWRNGSNGADVIWRSADARQQQAVGTVYDLRWNIVP